MKKIWGWIVGAVVVIVGGLYIAFGGSSSVQTPVPQPVATNIGTGTPAGQGSPSSSNTGGQTAGGTATTGQYKDGTYTGPVTDAIYGKIQVVATISGGKLVDTNCPIYPSDGGHTMQVSQNALPQLKQEAIAAQSANVNLVSGATQTSQAYQQSLAAALAQAKA